MDAERERELARAAESAARGVAGVARLYPPGGVLGGVVAAGTALLGDRPQLAAVGGGDDGVVVELTIGTDGSVPVPAVARSVHDEVDAALSAMGAPGASIRVTVAVAG